MNFRDLPIWVTLWLPHAVNKPICHAVNSLPYSTKKTVFRESDIGSGFFFKRNSKNSTKSARNQLPKRHLRKNKNLVLWHDLINYTMSSHKSNNYQHCSVPDFTIILRPNKDRLSALVYCQPIVTKDIFQKLLKSRVLVLSITKRFFSRRKKRRRSQNWISRIIRKLGWRLGD